MKKLIVCAMLQLMMFAVTAQEKTNQVDAQQRKQGPWIENVPELRGEEGYTWEGTYRNGRKEGVWKKYALSGSIISEETYKNNVLNGSCKYYYSNGRLNAEGAFLAVDMEGQKDTVMVIDPISGQETLTEIVRKGNSERQGLWKIFDEDGKMIKEYYQRGELVAPEEVDAAKAEAPANKVPASNALPHEKAGGAKKGKRP